MEKHKSAYIKKVHVNLDFFSLHIYLKKIFIYANHINPAANVHRNEENNKNGDNLFSYANKNIHS